MLRKALLFCDYGYNVYHIHSYFITVISKVSKSFCNFTKTRTKAYTALFAKMIATYSIWPSHNSNRAAIAIKKMCLLFHSNPRRSESMQQLLMTCEEKQWMSQWVSLMKAFKIRPKYGKRNAIDLCMDEIPATWGGSMVTLILTLLFFAW